jgi:hypothetical protein
MVQSYGAANIAVADTSTISEDRGVEESEDSALLGRDVAVKPREGHASIISSVSNLANTIIGSGASFHFP